MGSSIWMTRASKLMALAISTTCCSATERLRTRRCGRDVVDAEVGEQLRGVAVHAAGVDHAEAARLAAEPDVLGDGARRQQVELLEHGGEAGALRLDRVAEADLLAGELDGAGVGLVDAGEHLHERRLAGAVLADQAVHLARQQVEVGLAEHHVPGEGLGDTADAQHRLGGGSRGCGRRHARTLTQVDHLCREFGRSC